MAAGPHWLSLVVVTHNSEDFLRPFFETWRATAAAAGIVPGVVAVDSGSSDGSARIAAEFGARGIVLENRGFGAAANAGIKEAEGEWVLLCNPDLTFPVEFAGGILRAMEEASAETAVMAPRLLNGDGTVQASVGRFPTIGSVVRDQFRRRERRKYVVPQPGGECAVDWASGACLVLRRKWFEVVGGFDKRYFLYVEEVDLQRRMKDAGREVWFVPGVSVVHHRPNAMREVRGEVRRYAARGMLRYFAKFGTWWELMAWRKMGFWSGRLTWREACASRATILGRGDGG